MMKGKILLLLFLMPLCNSCSDVEPGGVNINYLPGKWEASEVTIKNYIDDHGHQVDTLFNDVYYRYVFNKDRTGYTEAETKDSMVATEDISRSDFTWSYDDKSEELTIAIKYQSIPGLYAIPGPDGFVQKHKVLYLTRKRMCLRSYGYEDVEWVSEVNFKKVR